MTALHAMKTAGDGDRLVLEAPTVGLWRDGPKLGELVRGGSLLGYVEILGVLHPITAPAGAVGVVVETADPSRARVPMQHGAMMLVLDPTYAAGVEGLASPEVEDSQSGLHLRSPMSGRFYTRPAPDKPVFVEVGTVLKEGQTVGLLEVMKTFNRITYGGDGLPAQARVIALLCGDGDEVGAHEPLLELEAVAT